MEIIGLDMYLYRAEGKYSHETFAKASFELSELSGNCMEQARQELSASEYEWSQEMKERATELFNEKQPGILTKYSISEDFMNSNDHAEVGYWRKHADLNEYFTDLYCAKTPEECQREFNLERLILTKDDILDLIEKVLQEIAKPGTVFAKGSGFFWGESIREDWIDTLNILNKVIKQTDFETQTIYYECWY